jgi:hypothetical protein
MFLGFGHASRKACPEFIEGTQRLAFFEPSVEAQVDAPHFSTPPAVVEKALGLQRNHFQNSSPEATELLIRLAPKKYYFSVRIGNVG